MGKTGMKQSGKRARGRAAAMVALAFASLALALALGGCDALNGGNEGEPVDTLDPGVVDAETAPNPDDPNSGEGRAVSALDTPRPIAFETAKDYEEIAAYVLAARDAFSRDGGVYGVAAMAVEEELAVEEPTADMASELKAADSLDLAEPAPAMGGTDYSETNVQVEGIDEGDIVKTDGRYIYILHDGDAGRELAIVSAQGGESVVVGRVADLDYGATIEDGNGYESQYSQELYIDGTTLAIVSTYYYWKDEMIDGEWVNDGDTRTLVDLYDVSDPSAPRWLCRQGQSGDYRTSRLLDGRLYVLSSYDLLAYGREIDEELAATDPAAFAPKLFAGDEARPVDATTVVFPPEGEADLYSVYSVLACYDFAALVASEGADYGAVSSIELLGGVSNFYMNEDAIYLWRVDYETVEGEPYQESVYTVVDYASTQMTSIYRVALDGAGGMALTAAATVPGSPESQFSLDEYEGYLRIATTNDRYTYKTYTDETMGFVNYADSESHQTNQLFVLDSNLNLVGSLDDIVADERVYSVRFAGPVGYVCTFRQIDPLFAVDLSDPSNPTLLSALEVPGFSEYLHVYGEGRLFGFGQKVDSEQGWANGLKLSMFNVSDPTAVSELAALGLDDTTSEALYNHHAIIVAPGYDFIGFPTGNGFEIYGYNDEAGFYERAFVDTGEWGWNLRGLYVGSFAYVTSNNEVVVLDMETLSEVARVALTNAG